MWLTAVEQASFGTLELSAPLSFSPGLNILIAANQAGKTTLLTLIEWMLYGVPPRASKRSQQAVAEWAPWAGAGRQPQATAVLAPQRSGWPERVRLSVHFDEFRPRLADAGSLGDLSSRIGVEQNGTWDLGQSLLGLRREAFSASLLALQGEQGGLENVLREENLRKLLTADLAGLVEDPERANLDAALASLDGPKFTCRGLQATPILISNLVLGAQRARDRLADERAALEERMARLEDALTRRDRAEHNLAEVARRRSISEEHLSRCDLTIAHWRFSQVDRHAEGLKDWERRLEQEPWLRDFPAGLEGAVRQWQGEIAQHKQAEERQRHKVHDLRERLDAVERQVQRDEPLLGTLGAQRELSELAAAIDAAQKDLLDASAKVKESGEAADPKARLRFDALDEQVRPYRDSLPGLLDWREAHARLTAQRDALSARRSALAAVARRGAPLELVLAVLAGGAGIALGALAPLVLHQPLLLIVAVLLLGAAVWLSMAGARRSRSATHASAEMRQVQAELTALAGAESQLSTRREELVRQLGLSAEAWAGLLAVLQEYEPLSLKHQNYAQARREQDAARARLAGAWTRVRELCSDAPADLDRAWLGKRLQALDDARDRQRAQKDGQASVLDAGRELEDLQRRQPELLKRLSVMLAPLGLGDVALSDPDSAIRRCENYGREARTYQAQHELLKTEEERAAALRMTREEYEQQLARLSPVQLREMGQLVQDEDGCRRLSDQRRGLYDEVVRLRREAEAANEEVNRLRQDLARHEDVLTRLPAVQEAEQAAARTLSKVQLWQRALDLLREALLRLRAELAGSLAPAITAHLRETLRHAPVRGVVDAALSEQLALRLRVEGAPPGLADTDLVERLSLGARRQLALAVRCAVALALGAEQGAPLFLDEPLAELDDENARAWLAYLGSLAKDRQVLLTTCHQAQYEWLIGAGQVEATVLALT